MNRPGALHTDSAVDNTLHLAGYSLDSYRIDRIDSVLTPALVIYPEIIDANISATLRLLSGNPNRWRPHVKTAKLAFVIRRLVQHGVTNFKCSTTLELSTACEAGATDVLLAYPLVGANARRVKDLRRQFPKVEISVLVENVDQVKSWVGSDIQLFIDVNPGMNRTGIDQERIDAILRVARFIEETGLVFKGIHYYDGHMGKLDLRERESAAHQGYDRLMAIIAAMQSTGIAVREVITSGTPVFPCALSYPALGRESFLHRVSPGTVVYGDCTSLSQLPFEYGYQPAALVVSTVVSQPTAHRITCDAGHKAVSADEGVPTCAVLGRPDLWPAKPSEEHLPIEVSPNSDVPRIGQSLYLVPRHVCPTVNNFDYAIVVVDGHISRVEAVTARGREGPLGRKP